MRYVVLGMAVLGGAPRGALWGLTGAAWGPTGARLVTAARPGRRPATRLPRYPAAPPPRYRVHVSFPRETGSLGLKSGGN